MTPGCCFGLKPGDNPARQPEDHLVNWRENTMQSSPEDTSQARRVVPRLLSGIGALGTAAMICEFVARAWPTLAGILFGSLFLFGVFWLAIITLRTCEQASVRSAAPLDRVMIRFAGPLSVLFLLLAATLGPANIEQVNGINRFSSVWSQTFFELMMAAGFVLALCAVISPRDTHIPPHWFWRIVAGPLVVISGMYALLTPISCAADGIRFP